MHGAYVKIIQHIRQSQENRTEMPKSRCIVIHKLKYIFSLKFWIPTFMLLYTHTYILYFFAPCIANCNIIIQYEPKKVCIEHCST